MTAPSLHSIEPRAKKMVFVGFEDGPGAVRYYDVATRSIRVSRDAWFNENDAANGLTTTVEVDIGPLWASGEEPATSGNDASVESDPPNPSSASIEGGTHHNPDNLASTTSNPPPTPPKQPAYSLRDRKPIDYKLINNPSARAPRTPAQTTKSAVEVDSDERANLVRAELAESSLATLFDVPANLAEAKSSSESTSWDTAMHEQLKLLTDRKTWRLEKLPAGQSVVGNTWTFAKKFDADGNLSRHKARLVAQGFSQIPGQDFNDTFSPVMRLESFRNLVAMAAMLDLELGQMDITGAYLNGDLKEVIYMRQPAGFNDGTGRFCRLLRPLYGLKQSGREWNIRLNEFLTNKLGYTRFDNIDHCVYIRRNGDSFDVIAVWVDDLLFLCSSLECLRKAKEEIHSEFEATDQGDPRLLLGIEIKRNRKTREIKISQGQFLRKLLVRFRMEDCHPVATPMENANHLLPATDANKFEDPSLYRAAIGSLMYAAIGTRPDLAFAVQKLAQFSHAPSNEHWTAVKRVFRYLKGTLDLGIVYSGTDAAPITVRGYSDADWATDRMDRKSISGYVFLLGGGAIAWSSKKQQTVALSSTEAEYMALTRASQHAIWLRKFFDFIGFPQPDPSLIFLDNRSALDLAYNPEFHDRSKHIDTRHHWIRDALADDLVTLEWIPTAEMVADTLTKSLSRHLFQKFADAMGMA